MEQELLIQFFEATDIISRQRAEQIAGQFTRKAIAKGEYLLKEGKVANEYIYLEDGFVRCFAIDTEGNEVTTNFYPKNQVVFEVSSFFNRVPARENIQALTDCSVWFITYRELNTLFHTLPEFREFGRHILVKGFTALKERVLSMITETAEERYAKLLDKHPEIFQHAALKHIASYLGITDTSLSRIRKELSKK